MRTRGMLLGISFCLCFVSICAIDSAKATDVGGIIAANTTWDTNGSPYVVVSNIFVGVGSDTVTLTIQPGVEVRFSAGTCIQIGYTSAYMQPRWGTLQAIGTNEAPIVFTSNATTPAPGDWAGISFTRYTSGNNTWMEHCVVEYGGTTAANINFTTSTPPAITIINSTIRYSAHDGIKVDAGSPVLSGNDFIGNARYPVSVQPNMLGNIGVNTASGNLQDAIEILGGTLVDNVTTWPDAGLPYLIAGIIYVGLPSANESTFATLNIHAGVEMRFSAGTQIQVGYTSAYMQPRWGALQAIGTSGAPIVFTSNSATPAPGDWKGIILTRLTSGNNTRMEHCVVEYGGQETADILVESTSPTITDCVIHLSATDGIKISGNANPIVTANEISQNVGNGIYVADGVPNPTVVGNNFVSNSQYPANVHPNTLINFGVNIASGNLQDAVKIYGGTLADSSTTWHDTGLPYIVAGNIYVGHSAQDGTVATLNIDAGVEMRFSAGTQIQLGYRDNYSHPHWGALQAIGTSDAPIVFTSNATTPAPGDWTGISFNDLTSGNNTWMEHCVVEYGGTTAANINFTTSTPPAVTIINSTIRYSAHDGIKVDAGSPVLSGNDFIGNARYPVSVQPNMLGNIGVNTASGNLQDAIEILGGTLVDNVTTWPDAGLPYIVAGNIYVGHSAQDGTVATLNIDAGVELRFSAGTQLHFGYRDNYSHPHWGALQAIGTSGTPIVFTSNATTPAAGDWTGIIFSDLTSGNNTRMEYCVVEYGGTTAANINFTTSTPPAVTIINSTIRYSAHDGIKVDAGSPVLFGNDFIGNARYPVSVQPNMLGNIGVNTASGNLQDAIEILGGTLVDSSTTWPDAGLPYVVAGNIIIGRPSTQDSINAALNIDAGVEMRFSAGTRIQVGYSDYNHYLHDRWGALQAKGTSEAPIVFTSNAATPAPGDWTGILFTNLTSGNNTRMEHCVVEYGGQETADIQVQNTSPTITDCVIHLSATDGIKISGSANPIVTSNEISQNAGNGIYVADGVPNPTVAGNSFLNNSQYPVNVHPNTLINFGVNSASGNLQDAVRILPQQMDRNTRWPKAGMPYVVGSTGSNEWTLTIEAGVEVRFDSGGGLVFGGGLQAAGTDASPIVFTSNAVTPAPGDWKGIRFSSLADTGSTRMEHCVVEYGGHTYGTNLYFDHGGPGQISNSTFTWSSGAGVTCSGVSPRVVNNTISNNATSGIRCISASPTVLNSIIAFSSAGPAVFCEGGSSLPVLKCCDVYGNANGDWVGCIAGQDGVEGNISSDPLFCNVGEHDFALNVSSPCLPAANSCASLIGARWVGCGGNFNLVEVASTSSTFTESMSVETLGLAGVVISGDLGGTLDFPDIEIVVVTSGSFADVGFFKGTWMANLEGLNYAGEWKGVAFPDSFGTQARLNLNGAVTGGLAGISEGFLYESSPGSGVFDLFECSWSLNRIGGGAANAQLQLEGAVGSHVVSILESELESYQAQMTGEVSSYHETPLSAVFTRVCVSDENEYNGQGFAMLSYSSNEGEGNGWAYCASPAMIVGMLSEPLVGFLSALLDTADSPTTLSGTLTPVGLGPSPQADLRVSVWGSSSLSPGQTEDLIIEVRNDGLASAEIFLVDMLDPNTTYVGCTAGGTYNDWYHEVAWDLGHIAAQTSKMLRVTDIVRWGVSLHTVLQNRAYIVSKDASPGQMTSQLAANSSCRELSCSESVLLFNGIDNGYDKLGYTEWEKFKFCLSATRVPDLYQDGVFWDSWGVYQASIGKPTENNGGVWIDEQSAINGGQIFYDIVIAYSGGTQSALTAIQKGKLKCNKLVLISPVTGCTNVDAWKAVVNSVLQNQENEGLEIVVYQSHKDRILGVLGNLIQVKLSPLRDQKWINQFGGRLRINPGTGAFHANEPLVICGKTIDINESDINDMTHVWFDNYILGKLGCRPYDDPSQQQTRVLVAGDPNAKYCSERYVQAGQTLNYTIEYENVGEGIAFGVYITDVLDPDLDDASIAVQNGGVYDSSTRTITWLVGQVNPGVGGSVTFSANLRGDAVAGTEAINYATVYFPSVPEITRTNGVVSVVPPGEPQMVRLYCGDDFTVEALSEIDSIPLGWLISNVSGNSYSFVYNVSSGGSATLVDNGDPSSINGNTPVLGPGESVSPPNAALQIPPIRQSATQTVVFQVTALEDPSISSTRSLHIFFEAPLSVLINRLDGRPTEQGIELTWDVATDEKIKGFDIYRRSEQEEENEKVNLQGVVPSVARTYVDKGVKGGAAYTYVLVVLLDDGSEVRSQEVEVKAKPYKLALRQNHPNPFNPSTKILFTLPERMRVTLSIYDVAGRQVRTLIDETVDEGYREYIWDGRDARGNPVGSGVYFYRLIAGKQTLTKKMVLIK